MALRAQRGSDCSGAGIGNLQASTCNDWANCKCAQVQICELMKLSLNYIASKKSLAAALLLIA